MKLNIGDTLVYPHHGAVTVAELKTRSFNSVETTFVRFRVHHNGLMIELPAANAAKVG
ncbi:CarD family transcriptional regulator, partial [Arthrobacter deserti]|nr:CarD family transcriptional regulator [Arthrobacter deserti]